MFNSPIDWCPVCKQWLALDEECPHGRAKNDCPLSAARAATAALMLRLDRSSTRQTHLSSPTSSKQASANTNTTRASAASGRSSLN